jgi:hypothetical protein
MILELQSKLSQEIEKRKVVEEKLRIHEAFLHKINLCMLVGDEATLKELLNNADAWSYAHRQGNGELSEKEQEKLINKKLQKLCKTTEQPRKKPRI